MDTKLEDQYPQKEAYTAATLALQCLNGEPKMRPRMVEALATLEQLQTLKVVCRASTNPVNMPTLKQHSPLNMTPSASPLTAHRRSPRIK